ncbi:hypothetical protein J3Q64DRAFT_1120825 [Phycomyces blakesleeanus]|uniref:Uncharacterized protein n=1 Tax=Phycomyces blakesleeanus TaxID=4837 RepID=A0ABR3AYR3_PHYBL
MSSSERTAPHFPNQPITLGSSPTRPALVPSGFSESSIKPSSEPLDINNNKPLLDLPSFSPYPSSYPNTPLTQKDDPLNISRIPSPLSLKPSMANLSINSESSIDALSSSGRLVPGAQARHNGQQQQQQLLSTSVPKLSPRSRPESPEDGIRDRPMSRARSHSDQTTVREQLTIDPKPNHPTALSVPGTASISTIELQPSLSLKPTLMSTSPLARRVS